MVIKMGIGGISPNQYTEGARVRQTAQKAGTSSAQFAQQMNKAAGVKAGGYKVYMKTEDMLYSGGNGSGLSFYIKYAEGSTEEDPTVVAKGVDENGKEFEQTIHINDINPRSATLVQMRALEAYLGVDKNGGLSSLPQDPSLGNMGLYDRANFMDMFQKSIRDMNTLGERKLAAYYRYSMQMYQDFMAKKRKDTSPASADSSPFGHWQKQMCQAKKELSAGQESESDAEIITQPDGSKTLMITTQIGSMKSVMSVRISEPSAFWRDQNGPDMLANEDVRPDRLKNGDWQPGENG